MLLSACASEPVRPVGSTRPGAPPRPTRTPTRPSRAPLVPAPHRLPPPSAHVQSLPGLEGVIGVDASALSRLFGPPRLDVLEGDARKLQFVGPACVLDVYLYPASEGAPPRATYVDARRATDARDVDRAACVAALKRR